MNEAPEIWVNDVHSGLNRTAVHRVESPATAEELTEIVHACASRGEFISVSGCRHAMGGQQFLTGGVLVDTRRLTRILNFDRGRGLIRAEAGIQWPELIAAYLDLQAGGNQKWGIRQKQTGADNFTLGGSLGANAHGRGLRFGPIIQDVEAFTLLKPDGTLVHCSRNENARLFSLAVGGYGLFGVITDVTLRLGHRQLLERLVEIVPATELMARFDQRISEGCVYGDFQFSIDEKSRDFLQLGVFSCYRPTDRPLPAVPQQQLKSEDWLRMLHLAYTDRAEVFKRYADFYLSTYGQLYWSDMHQLGPYLPDYAEQIQKIEGTQARASLMISELYVPRSELAAFLAESAEMLRALRVTVIYGTIRLIEKDGESFLAWARESFACVIFNLLVEHSESGKALAAKAFRALIDLAVQRGGSFFLTYHRWATRKQIETCYPQFAEFLMLKKMHDPAEFFQSDWYRHYRALFA